MKRTTLNFIIDSNAFLDLLGLAFTGFIMMYILPPGTGGRGRMFRGGRGAEHVGEEIKELWSMTRHEWGVIHFYLVSVAENETRRCHPCESRGPERKTGFPLPRE